jgi:hypothetical protein
MPGKSAAPNISTDSAQDLLESAGAVIKKVCIWICVMSPGSLHLLPPLSLYFPRQASEGGYVTSDQLESLEDIQDLVKFAEAHENDSLTSWSAAAVSRIIAPLLNLPPEHWPLQSRRVELLGMRPVDDEDSTPEIHNFIEGPLAEYVEKWENVGDNCLWQADVTYSIKHILTVVAPMVHKATKDWTHSEIESATKVLGGGPSIEAAGASSEEMTDWEIFAEKWETFVYQNPAILRRVDPFYVIINVFGAPPPAALAGAIAAFPPAGSAFPGPGPGLNGCPYILPFGRLEHANYFVGHIQNACPGLHAWVTRNAFAPLHL